MPSGTLWATTNIQDADGNELYFAWGETQGYTLGQVGTDKYFEYKEVFPDSDYKYGVFDRSDGENWGMTKYNNADGKTALDTSDDAATANWGSDWRMPTKEQFEELTANTTRARTQVDGVDGLLFTSTANTNTLFFPAVGYAREGEVSYFGNSGYYWSVSLYVGQVDTALRLKFYGGGCVVNNDDRCCGYSVRPVRV